MTATNKLDTHLALLVGLGALLISTTQAIAQSQVHEEAIAKAYANWVRVTNEKDIQAWAEFLAPDPIFLPANHPALTDREAILEYYEGLFADDLFSLNCRQEQVEVAASEDIAWASGRCEVSFTNAEGRMAQSSSRWVKVWKRLPSDEWKCAANSWGLIPPP